MADAKVVVWSFCNFQLLSKAMTKNKNGIALYSLQLKYVANKFARKIENAHVGVKMASYKVGAQTWPVSVGTLFKLRALNFCGFSSVPNTSQSKRKSSILRSSH